MTFLRGDVVRSVAGHDRGDLFLVLRERATFSGWWTENAENLRLPKKNGESTLFPRGSGRTRLPAACKTAEPVLDSDIRRALAAFRNRFSEMKEV